MVNQRNWRFQQRANNRDKSRKNMDLHFKNVKSEKLIN